MNALEKIRAALEFADLATGGKLIPKDSTIKDALAALAELERASKEPAAWRLRFENGPWVYRTRKPDCSGLQPLYTTPPPAPVAAPQFEAVEVDDVVAESCVDAFNASDSRDYRKHGVGRRMIAAVRAELGPTLGLAVMMEPTPEECEWIWNEYALRIKLTSNAEHSGREMFRAVRAVMWPKGGKS